MSLAVVTPSYRHDAELFADLHRSVVRATDESVAHHVIVPRADVELFAGIGGRRCVVTPEESLYPPHFRPARAVNRLVRFLPRVSAHVRIAAIDRRPPFRPVRGWMMQQVLKLEMCRRLSADTVVLIDSDVELVRPVTEAGFRAGELARLYRLPQAVDGRLPHHMAWNGTARRLLGLPAPAFPASDYISSLCVWEPAVVRAMLARVEQVAGRPWADAVLGQPTFSEWTLYGIFAEEVLRYGEEAKTDSSRCHSYWGTDPLAAEDAAGFAAQIRLDDVAVLIQSKTGTSREVRRAVIDAIGKGSNAGGRWLSAPAKRELSSRAHPAGGTTATETRTTIANAKKKKVSASGPGPPPAADSRPRMVEPAVPAGPSGRERISALPLRLRRTTRKRSPILRGAVMTGGSAVSIILISDGLNHRSANRSSAIKSGSPSAVRSG